jgi:hypothetical protein
MIAGTHLFAGLLAAAGDGVGVVEQFTGVVEGPDALLWQASALSWALFDC